MTIHEWASDPDERYGIYRRREDWPMLLATCGKDGIGQALVTLHSDGDLTPDDRVGVMDGIDGVWVVNPYAAGRVAR